MSITRRQILENLTLVRGHALASASAVDGLSGLDEAAFVDALSRKQSLEPQAALGELSTRARFMQAFA